MFYTTHLHITYYITSCIVEWVNGDAQYREPPYIGEYSISTYKDLTYACVIAIHVPLYDSTLNKSPW